MRNMRTAFTLIELLIVVAIIAILAAIAVPNFLEAQTRAKVARAKADMRSLGTAIETYHIDHNTYLYCNRPAFAIKIPGHRNNQRETFERLTTPIAYLSGIEAFTDPFITRGIWNEQWTQTSTFNTGTEFGKNDQKLARIYFYYARNERPGGNARWDQAERNQTTKPKTWFTESAGPDGMRYHGDKMNPGNNPTMANLSVGIYDASNGTVSAGSIWRSGGTPATEGDQNFFQLISGSY